MRLCLLNCYFVKITITKSNNLILIKYQNVILLHSRQNKTLAKMEICFHNVVF